jgi:peptide/nickel transport system substrate-binding protein
MNVEMVATDWGTVVAARVSARAVEKGGWSVPHLGASTIACRWSTARSGLGPTAWFGCADHTMEVLTRRFVEPRPTPARRDVLSPPARLRDGACTARHVQIRTAYRRGITGVIEATGPYFWNVRRAPK